MFRAHLKPDFLDVIKILIRIRLRLRLTFFRKAELVAGEKQN